MLHLVWLFTRSPLEFYSTGCLISIWTILWGCFEVTRWLKIIFFNSSEKFMQIPLKVNKINFLWHQAWPHNDLLLLKSKNLKLHFLQGILFVAFFGLFGLKNVKDSQFWCYIVQKNKVLFNNSVHAWFVHTSLTSQFSLQPLLISDNFGFCWSSQIRHPHRSRPSSFFCGFNWICFLKFFDLIGICAFGDLSNGRVINGVNNPRLRITSLP